jgi:signal transduction histidine kinase
MKPLRVLIVEDSEQDADLLLRELKKAGYSPIHKRVDSAGEMSSALDTESWDIIISDHSMPGFSSLDALSLLRGKSIDLPFIIVSGQIGEDTAVGAMKAGAHDYMMKGSLKRLGPAIERELQEASNRHQRRKAEEQLRALSKRLIEVQEEERRSIARELHDQVGQYLTITKLMLDRATKATPETVTPLLIEITAQVVEVLQQVRNMSLNLRPSMLDDLGLVPALKWLFERLEKQSGLNINFEHNMTDNRVSPDIDTTIYRIVQEALTNVIRHAGVTSAKVRLWLNEKTISLKVEDNGQGFEPDRLAARVTTGLSAMQERARLLGGYLRIESVPGAGTRVVAEIPIPNDG